MVSKRSYTQYLKPRMLSFTILLLIICAGLIVYARTSRGSKNPYSLAEDLPRGALVYAQFRDLPALIKQWDESRLKQQYLSSTNYVVFACVHNAGRSQMAAALFNQLCDPARGEALSRASNARSERPPSGRGDAQLASTSTAFSRPQSGSPPSSRLALCGSVTMGCGGDRRCPIGGPGLQRDDGTF